jgi:hypothetical protein
MLGEAAFVATAERIWQLIRGQAAAALVDGQT